MAHHLVPRDYHVAVSPRRLIVGASILMLVVALGACRSAQPQSKRATTTLGSTTTTLGSTTTTSRLAGSTTPTTVLGGCPTGVGVAAQSERQAALCLYEAWKKNDRKSAVVYASIDVVDILFRQQWSPPEATFKGCSAEPSTGGQTCTFEHHGTPYLFGVQRSEGGLRVTEVHGPPGA